MSDQRRTPLLQTRCHAALWRSIGDGVLPVSRQGNQTQSNRGRFTWVSDATAGPERGFPCFFPVQQGTGRGRTPAPRCQNKSNSRAPFLAPDLLERVMNFSRGSSVV
jgi:hypothetical protein